MYDLTTNEFEKIVLAQTPLADVRAPIEFEKGAFLNSVNLPIMDNEDRHVIGTCYKEHGNEEAVKLGHARVSGNIREVRTQAWVNFLKENPDAFIYCFRGGSRSRIAQQWIYEATGRPVARLEGGYKAFRTYLMDALTPAAQTSKPIILGGCTGSGKTIVLKKLQNAIDLEGIANHRGSSFGNHVTSQPSQISFENNLAYALIQHKAKGFNHMVLEDEGRHVGTNFLPPDLAQYFNEGDLVIIDVPLEERVQITLQEYVCEAQAEYIDFYKDSALGMQKWSEYIINSFMRVKKRLGGDRLQTMLTLFDQCYAAQKETNSPTPHMAWIELFLSDYYDPMYLYQLEKTTKKIIYRGNTDDVTAFLQELK